MRGVWKIRLQILEYVEKGAWPHGHNQTPVI